MFKLPVTLGNLTQELTFPLPEKAFPSHEYLIDLQEAIATMWGFPDPLDIDRIFAVFKDGREYPFECVTFRIEDLSHFKVRPMKEFVLKKID